MRKLIIAAIVALGLGVSQTSTERVYAWTFDGRNFALREIVGLTRTASGWAIPAAPAAETFRAGQGIVLVRTPGQPTEISVETAAFWLWAPAPTGPGPCRVSDPDSDQRSLAEGGGYVYMCVPNPTAPGLYRWGRAPLEFAW